MQGFNGFPDGSMPTLPLPRQFFSEVLPYIDHIIELKATLYAFWALYAQEGRYRYVRLSEVLADAHFMRGIPETPQGLDATVKDGFDRAVVRGTLIHARIEFESHADDVYFVNSEKGRRARADLQSGTWHPNKAPRSISMVSERPNIFRVYEQNIGMLSPIIAEQLQDLERDFSSEWVYDAIRAAANKNKRHLSYIVAVLKSWQREGRAGQGEALTDQREEKARAFKERFAHMFSAEPPQQDDHE